MRIVILIPTYNEAENIGRLLRELIPILAKIKKHRAEVLVVDDTSPDGTADIVRGLQKKHKNIHLLMGKKNGLGNAMIRGYRYAMETLKADVVVANEADFAFDFKTLPVMIKRIEEGFDVVVASRHVGDGKTEGWTLNRKLNHWVANTVFATWIAGVREVYDHNGAYRAIRVKGVLDSIGLKKFRVTGFGFFFYLMYKLTTVTEKIYEFPVTYTFRTAGESKVSFNRKYVKTYARDVMEYVKLAFSIRKEKSTIK